MTRLDKLQLAVEKGFTYDYITGIITNPTGNASRCVTKNGYIKLSLWSEGKRYYLLGHQLAWFIYYNETVDLIDHKDTDKTNNAINNLRKATKSQNAMNMKNAKGYCYCKRSGKFESYINVNGKKTHLGYFILESDASDAYRKAKEIYHVIK